MKPRRRIAVEMNQARRAAVSVALPKNTLFNLRCVVLFKIVPKYGSLVPALSVTIADKGLRMSQRLLNSPLMLCRSANAHSSRR